jgi:hypothetical protein
MNTESNNYRSFWANAEEGKKKGSGIGLLIDKEWSKHITRIDKYNAYALRAEFSFRKAKIVV